LISFIILNFLLNYFYGEKYDIILGDANYFYGELSIYFWIYYF